MLASDRLALNVKALQAVLPHCLGHLTTTIDLPRLMIKVAFSMSAAIYRYIDSFVLLDNYDFNHLIGIQP